MERKRERERDKVREKARETVYMRGWRERGNKIVYTLNTKEGG